MKLREDAGRMITELIEHGISMLDLAERANVGYTTVRLIRQNQSGRISNAVYNAIRAVYEQEMAARRRPQPSDQTSAVIREPVASYASSSPEPPPAPIPSSAADMYDDLEFSGGKPDWIELPDSTRDQLENLHKRLELEVDGIEAKYQRAVRAAAVDRSAGLEEAVRQYRLRFLDALMEGKR